MKLLVSCLEYSSNAYLKTLASKLPEAEFTGIYDFGEQKGEFTPGDFSIMGFVDVFKKLAFIKRAQNRIVELAKEADLVLLSDSSSFNLPLAKKIKKAYPQKKVYYYILPQVWAWKSWRAKSLDRYCDKLLATLPFEAGYYQKAEYVGHPLLDKVQRAGRSSKEKIAYLPGSRVSEIKALMPVFKVVAEQIAKPSVVVVPDYLKNRIDEVYGNLGGFEISFDMNEGLKDVGFVFACSGTATLEVSLMGVPLVLAYKAKKPDYFIAKTLVGVKFIGLANIFADKAGLPQVHPELLQEAVNSESLLETYNAYDLTSFEENSAFLWDYLQHGSVDKVVEIIRSSV